MKVKDKYLSIKEMEILNEKGNEIMDVHSTFISKNIIIGTGNIIYPSSVFEANDDSKIEIGDNNYFGIGTHLKADNDNKMTIGSNCRIDGKISLYGNSTMGNGSQILGFIQVYNCNLESGESYKHNDPNFRGAVLKGVGRAKNLNVKKGYVINGVGDFLQDNEELQINYHKS